MNSRDTHEQIRSCPLCGNRDTRLWQKEGLLLLVRCRVCSLVYVGNPPTEKTLYEEYYAGTDPLITDYNPESGDPALAELSAINRQRIALIRKLAPAGRLLDVGCGRGFFLKTASSAGYLASGVDVSERAVVYARTVARVDASTDSLQSLAARGKQFDVVTAWHVLEHFTDPLGELRVIRTLLVDGGLLVVEVPNLRSLRFTLARHKWRGGDHPRYHRTFFTAPTLRRVLVETGFAAVTRIPLSYHLRGRHSIYEAGKQLLNVFAADAFLDFTARKERP